MKATDPASRPVPVVEFHGVQRHFGEPELVLDDVTFQIQRGDVVGLLGKNGAGKTTSIRMVLGMLHPHRGSVRVFGADPRDRPVQVKQRIGYVSDAQMLPPYLRAREAFALHAGLFPTWDPKLAERLKERFEISGARKIRDMSKGEARRVAVACAIAHRPELLLLDEPASGFDPAARREFLEVALEHLQDTESTILFSSHQMDDIERLANRVLFLHRSRLVLDEPLADLQETLTLLTAVGHEDNALELRESAACITARMVGGEVRALFRLLRGSPAEALGEAAACCPDLPFTSRQPRLEDIFIELAESRVQPRHTTSTPSA